MTFALIDSDCWIGLASSTGPRKEPGDEAIFEQIIAYLLACHKPGVAVKLWLTSPVAEYLTRRTKSL